MATYRILAWSEPGQGKTSFSLLGTQKKWYAQLDSGSYQRAVDGAPIDESLITVENFFVPLTALTDRAKLDTSMVGREGKGPVQFVHKLEGWDEKLQEFFDRYVWALQQDFDTIIIDTSTKLWELMRKATQQRIQEQYPQADWAAQIKRAEYAEPNSQMSQVIEAADTFNKNLVLLAHEAEAWVGGSPTGKFKPKGSDDAPKEVNLIMKFSIQNKVPTAEFVDKAPLGLLGLKMEKPTLDDVFEVIRNASIINKMGGTLPNPLTPESIANSAKVFQAAML
jgi:hypothetical protein